MKVPGCPNFAKVSSILGFEDLSIISPTYWYWELLRVKTVIQVKLSSKEEQNLEDNKDCGIQPFFSIWKFSFQYYLLEVVTLFH